MKKRTVGMWSFGLSLVLLPLAGGCLQQTTNPPVYSAIPAEPAAVTESVVAEPAPEVIPVATTVANTPLEAPAPAVDITNAPATPVSPEKPLPAGIRPGSPTAELVKLANSSVDEATLLAFVTNSPGTFSLSADDIIYLNDIGIPGPVITAMLQRDQALKAASATAAAPVPVYTTPTNQVAPTYVTPPPAEAAPQPAYAASAYPAAVPAAEPTYAVDSTFYEPLSPYGTWVNVDGYGLCWQPSVVVVNPGWRPYCDAGHWVYTDAGWYWYSDYSWGWAPFHYGRWFRHQRLGWCWYPDRVWGPSWVSWRYADSYCGWAPLPPGAYYRPGIGLTWYGRSVAVGFNFGLGADCFAFVGWGHFHDHHLNHYAVPSHQVTQVYNKTVIVNNISGSHNTVVNHGIAPERVAAATHHEVRPVAIREVSVAKPVAGRGERLEANNRGLTVYRPRIPETARSTTPITEHSRPAVDRGNAPAASVTPATTPAGTGRSVATRPTASGFAPEKSQPSAPSATRSSVVEATKPGPAATPPPASRPQPPTERSPVVRNSQPSAAPAKAAPPASSMVIIGRQNNAANQTRSTVITRSQPARPSASASTSGSTPAPKPVITPSAPTVSTPAPAPAVSVSRPAPAPTRTVAPPTVSRVETPRATPSWENRASTPAAPASPPSRPATPSYQAPVRTTPTEASRPAYSPAPTPAYRSAPVETPRSYSAPAMTPSRPAMAEAPRYSPPPAMAAPSRAPAMPTHSAPAPSAPSASRNSSDKAGRQ